MSESEEIKPAQEQKSSSATEAVTPSVDVPAPLPEAEPTKEGSPETESPKEVSPASPHLQKVELKKHSPPVPHPAPAAVPAAPPAPAPVLNHPTKEVAANAPQAGMEVEIDFVLDRKRISLTELSTLAVGEMITLSGADFKATLFLQEKAIAEAELVMVDQKPSLQITKIFSAS